VEFRLTFVVWVVQGLKGKAFVLRRLDYKLSWDGAHIANHQLLALLRVDFRNANIDAHLVDSEDGAAELSLALESDGRPILDLHVEVSHGSANLT
jgi:hypothetical protein